MLSNPQKMQAIACFSFVLAIALGAFGAHAWEPILEANGRFDVFETASQYHFYAALFLLLVNLQAKVGAGLVNSTILGGQIVFSGSLYLLALLNIGWLGAITPIGGVLLIVGAGVAAFRFWSRD